MKRFATSLATLALALAPAVGFAATNDSMDDHDSSHASSNAGISLDLLSVTDFALNPTDDTWLSVVQQIRAHPCYTMVGEEKDMCKDEFGLKMDLRTTLAGTDFSSWLHNAMVHSVCGGQTGANYTSCVMRVPTLGAADILRYRQQLDGSFGFETGGNAGVAPGGFGGTEQDDMTETNEALFERAGTPLTTRQNALDIIAEAEENDELTPYQRSTMLWDWCEDSHMGQSGCFHSFQRYVDDPSIDHDTIKAVIEANGRSPGRNDDRNDDDEDDNKDEDDEDMDDDN